MPKRVGGSSPYDSPLGGSASNGMTTAQLVSAAADVGLQVLYTRSFGSFTSAGGRDPIISAMMQVNAPLLLMDSNPDPGAIIGKFRGHSMSAGRGLLIFIRRIGPVLPGGYHGGRREVTCQQTLGGIPANSRVRCCQHHISGGTTHELSGPSSPRRWSQALPAC